MDREDQRAAAVARFRRHHSQQGSCIHGQPAISPAPPGPLNLLFRRQLIYRITDFFPECLMAELGRTPAGLALLYRLTVFWRRRVSQFEVLGEDQRRRLVEIGIDESRIVLRRDPSPVSVPPSTRPLPRPPSLTGKRILLYSGNFGVAHDHETFLAAYERHHRHGNAGVALWLNATGARANALNAALIEKGTSSFPDRAGAARPARVSAGDRRCAPHYIKGCVRRFRPPFESVRLHRIRQRHPVHRPARIGRTSAVRPIPAAGAVLSLQCGRRRWGLRSIGEARCCRFKSAGVAPLGPAPARFVGAATVAHRALFLRLGVPLCDKPLRGAGGIMHGKARILILIGGHLWTSPRSQKEAEVLAAAGYDVTINGVWFDQSGAERDSKLLGGKAWAYRPILDLRADTPSSRFCNLAVRARRRIESKLCSGLGARFPAALGYGAQQFRKAALRHSADLTIVHSEPNLWVGSELLDRGRRVGVDFEDWFSEDLRGDEPQSEAMRWLQELEGRLARECSYSITTSRALSGALAARYSAPLPAVVYNVFPFAEASAIDRTFHDRKNLGIPSVHWFSQTIGPGRGLEMFFAATRGITEAFEVHLRGKMALGYADSFSRLIPDHIRERVFIHDTVPNAALLSRISEHDIGLALETSTRASRNLSITKSVSIPSGRTRHPRHADGGTGRGVRTGTGRGSIDGK